MTQEEQMAMMKELEALRARVSTLESELQCPCPKPSSDDVVKDRESLIKKQNDEIRVKAETIKSQAEEIKNKDIEIKKKDKEIEKMDAKIQKLAYQLEWLQKRVFGRMTEKRHLPENSEDLPSLFPEYETSEGSEIAESESKAADTAMNGAIKHRAKPSRRKLDTEGLPVDEVHIYPEGTTDKEGKLLPEYTVIGTETTDTLKAIPARIAIERTMVHKVVLTSELKTKKPEERTILEAEKPLQAIKRCMAGPSVLVDIIILKFLYHLPFYRVIKQYKEGGITINDSTMGGWYEATVERLKILYDLLRTKVMSSIYIQVDESVIPVIDNEKHRARKGYEWVVRDGISGNVFFWYDCGSRSYKTARALLSGYQGTIQTDGYGAYDQFEGKKGVTVAGCWAHARRKYTDALKEDKKRADHALDIIGRLYAIESEATEAGLDADQRKEKRQKEAYPLIKKFEKWLEDNYCEVLPKSRIGTAIAYSYGLIDRLSAYVNDGNVNIDNNLIENQVRPLALGRKNYLFCGNDASAYRAAIVYSLIGTCKAMNIDPRIWMEDALKQMPYYERDGKDLSELLPDSWAKKHQSNIA